MSDRRCAACGATGSLRRVEDGVFLCDPPVVSQPPSCFREWHRGNQQDEIARQRSRAFGLAKKLGFDTSDRHEFTLSILSDRGRDAVSWADNARHPLNLKDWERLNHALRGAEVAISMYRSQHPQEEAS